MGNQASMLRSAPGAGWSWWDAAMGLGLLTDTADTHPTSTQPWGATNSQRCPAASERAPPSSTCHKPPHPLSHTASKLCSPVDDLCKQFLIFFSLLFKEIVAIENNIEHAARPCQTIPHPAMLQLPAVKETADSRERKTGLRGV